VLAPNAGGRRRPHRRACHEAVEHSSLGIVPRVVVDVVPNPEILDPQGQAIVRALPRMGLRGVRDVRQGKHFELDVDDDVDAETLHRIAGELLANPVIENWTVRRL
jgi:phosphoribosylformylglycinamidine synthase PurS subunit